MSKLSLSKFCHSTQCSADALTVALLWKLPQMPSCSANNANLDENKFDMFTKLIAVQPSMAKYEWTMHQMKVDYAIMHWNQFCYIYFLLFWKIWSQTWVSFFYNLHCTNTYKMCPIQYLWTIRDKWKTLCMLELGVSFSLRLCLSVCNEGNSFRGNLWPLTGR